MQSQQEEWSEPENQFLESLFHKHYEPVPTNDAEYDECSNAAFVDYRIEVERRGWLPRGKSSFIWKMLEVQEANIATSRRPSPQSSVQSESGDPAVRFSNVSRPISLLNTPVPDTIFPVQFKRDIGPNGHQQVWSDYIEINTRIEPPQTQPSPYQLHPYEATAEFSSTRQDDAVLFEDDSGNENDFGDEAWYSDEDCDKWGIDRMFRGYSDV